MFCQVKSLHISVGFNVFNNCRPLTSTLYPEDVDSFGREPKQACLGCPYVRFLNKAI
jgi:hypothetical protein